MRENSSPPTTSLHPHPHPSTSTDIEDPKTTNSSTQDLASSEQDSSSEKNPTKTTSMQYESMDDQILEEGKIGDGAVESGGGDSDRKFKGDGKGNGSDEVDEMRARKIEALKSRIEALSAELAAVKEKLAVGTKELKNQPASTTVKQHIHLLHKYNEIRDIGQGLIGMIAENRGVRISDAYEEFGVGFGD